LEEILLVGLHSGCVPNPQKIKTNEGAAFEFFRKSQSKIFFDDPHDARMVFMEYRFL
jgi:hypothetical protein